MQVEIGLRGEFDATRLTSEGNQGTVFLDVGLNVFRMSIT